MVFGGTQPRHQQDTERCQVDQAGRNPHAEAADLLVFERREPLAGVYSEAAETAKAEVRKLF